MFFIGADFVEGDGGPAFWPVSGFPTGGITVGAGGAFVSVFPAGVSVGASEAGGAGFTASVAVGTAGDGLRTMFCGAIVVGDFDAVVVVTGLAGGAVLTVSILV
jgi:hypothetical protein